MSRNLRIHWEFEKEAVSNKKDGGSLDEASGLESLACIHDLLFGNNLTSHFQPIYATKDGSVFGFEALARLTASAPFSNLEEMFHAAQATGSLSALDAHCMVTALKCLNTEQFLSSRSLLFLNACPETLMNLDVSFGIVSDTLQMLSVPPERIILEITEESVVSNYDLFQNSLKSLRKRGFRVAIDDFGSGYAGLKMLSTIEPDFLKIDRHFISNIDRAIIKFNLVDAIATACNRIGIHIVAEGIERPEELDIINDLGIEFLQGFMLARPSAELNFSPAIQSTRKQFLPARIESTSDRCFIGDIVNYVEPVSPSDKVVSALSRFLETKGLYALPVVMDKKVMGVLNRNRFFEDQVVDASRKNIPICATKHIGDVMDRDLIAFDVNCTLAEASKKITAKSGRFTNDNLIILKHGYYHGMVEIHLLLEALSEQNILLARDANPLSGLPGNNTIQREIARRLAQNMHFDVLYIDIDHFKPFNDCYGFARGDLVIFELAGIIRQTLQEYDAPFNFAGHIGGDDFIVITRPTIGLNVAQSVIDQFAHKLDEFHGKSDFRDGFFSGMNRIGEKESFDLLSLSIGIVSTEVFNVNAYSQLASIACEVKKAAKQKRGSSIVRDQRLLG
jgi:diguanylate cyclase (GGDEF)-like protein